MSNVRVLREEREPLRFEPVDQKPDPETPKPPKPVKEVIFPSAEVMAVFRALSVVLATRAILLLAGIGAFALAYLAIDKGTIAAGLAAAVFDLFVLLPCVALARSGQ